MPTLFIFHGVGGHSKENWFPWLQQSLETERTHVVVPDFPHSDHPDLAEWLEHFRPYQRQLDDRTVFVGHSLGGAFALRLLEKIHTPIRACFLVASVWGVMGNQFDPVMRTFTVPPYDWKTIRQNARYFSVIHSDNDPYIKLSQAEELAKHLSTAVTLVRGGGHLNAGAGYTEFPLLPEQISAAA
ncbi:MAG: alpha/beta fold hydrolase [Candidatus Peribacteraceae bacterium]|jgi:predicted alpha/beta hydrolase family esterase|nr:alpha/beta fold hydrolase [Candidatus Peribacteraceae bacterium]